MPCCFFKAFWDSHSTVDVKVKGQGVCIFQNSTPVLFCKIESVCALVSTVSLITQPVLCYSGLLLKVSANWHGFVLENVSVHCTFFLGRFLLMSILMIWSFWYIQIWNFIAVFILPTLKVKAAHTLVLSFSGRSFLPLFEAHFLLNRWWFAKGSQ